MINVNELLPRFAAHNSRLSRAGKALIAVSLWMKVFEGAIVIALTFLICSLHVLAQGSNPNGSMFNGNSSNLSNSAQSIAWVARNLVFIGGIIAICAGVTGIWAGWRYGRMLIGGAACFGVATILSVAYDLGVGAPVTINTNF